MVILCNRMYNSNIMCIMLIVAIGMHGIILPHYFVLREEKKGRKYMKHVHLFPGSVKRAWEGG